MYKRNLAAVWLWWAPEAEVNKEPENKQPAGFPLEEERIRAELAEQVETPREKVERLLAGTDVRRLML